MSAEHADIPRRVDADGRVWFSGEAAAELVLRGFDITKLLIDQDAAVAEYNDWCERTNKSNHRLQAEAQPIRPLTERLAEWWLPPPYLAMNVRDELLTRCATAAERDRVNLEMDLFEARDMINPLRVMFMLVDHFRRNKIVWGVGRGSSVASYVLFLIGIHKIDSLAYDLDITEFLRD